MPPLLSPAGRQACPATGDGFQAAGSVSGAEAGAAVGSVKKGPKPWPSGSAKSRLYMKPRSSGGLASVVPPAAAALSQIASTSARLSIDKAIRSCAPARGSAIGLGVSVEKNALSDTMKVIVSDHLSAEAWPALRLGSFTKPNAS